MGMLDKLKFWKREEKEFEFGKESAALPEEGFGEGPHGIGGGLPGEEGGKLGEEDFGLGPTPGKPGELAPGKEKESVSEEFFGLEPRARTEPRVSPAYAPSREAPQVTSATREMEIINLKLDSIRNTLENINIRLERIERMASGEKEHEKRVW